jgi:hypothetical protein
VKERRRCLEKRLKVWSAHQNKWEFLHAYPRRIGLVSSGNLSLKRSVIYSNTSFGCGASHTHNPHIIVVLLRDPGKRKRTWLSIAHHFI